MNSSRHGRGLTPVEVLLVMAILALLIATILPGLHRLRQHAFAVACTNHLASLGSAHFLYAQDNAGRLPSSDWWLASAEILPRYLPQQRLPPVPGGTNPALEYLKTGQIFPYVEDPDVYLCPSDSRRRTHRRAEPIDFISYGANEDIRIPHPLQPYSVQDGLLQLTGGSPDVYLTVDSLRPPPESTASFPNPAPMEDRSSKVFLLMEEHEDNTLDDAHVSTREPYTDALTLRHGGEGKMFFFDRHIESIKAEPFNAANRFVRARYFIGQDIFQP